MAGKMPHGGGELPELENQAGFLLKKRKWPLKGWHKRYFVLQDGILKYAKTPMELQRGKIHGSMDVGLSVMSVKRKAGCIDLDDEENIYHLKITPPDVFDLWLSKLRQHRQHWQNKAANTPPILPASGESEPSTPMATTAVPVMYRQNTLSRQASVPGSTAGTHGKVTTWLDPQDMEKCQKELSQCQSELEELVKLLHTLQRSGHSPSACDHGSNEYPLLETSKKERYLALGKIWGGRSSKENKLKVPVSEHAFPLRLHASNPDLVMGTAPCPPCLSASLSEGLNNLDEKSDIYQSYCLLAQQVHASLQVVMTMLQASWERGRLLPAESDQVPGNAQTLALRRSLAQAKSQNAELCARLQRIHQETQLPDHLSSFLPGSPLPLDSPLDRPRTGPPLLAQLSDSQVSVTECEFFDALEVLRSSSSSENEGSEDDASSISDLAEEGRHGSSLRPLSGCSDDVSPFRTGRRTELPAMAPDHSTIALWDVLRRNVGKDLSRVTMPVELNEPLNTLQHLCEELEYSDLLDRAAETEDPVQRMVLVAAFAVSLYSCTATRATCKPFNPFLGETYECEREDRAFRFIAEQVSHHPPISACHCESKKFIFWQDIRWKNKFWGKSMEIIPIGTVHLSLPRYGDKYQWNKVTSCVHNVLVGQRWVEHYGEINIRNRADDSCHCVLSFLKGNYWSSSANEVQGSLLDASGHVVQRLFGKWTEGLYSGAQRSAKCIWRPGALPANHELYYGFTHFAIELNELDPNLRPFLPPTDTRFRPDQRFLEEGNLEMASRRKQHLEEMQRQRWNNMEGTYQPRFFRKARRSDGQEEWVTNNTYWELRKNPGFSNMENPILW
uniref:oxysterol-binding protein-related protein 6-like n=2 Tax=Myxine glutinosa TaxID=7769 RepID=UPI00358F47A9